MIWTPPPAEATVRFTAPRPKEMTLDPNQTLLCVIDMQNTFCTPGFVGHYSERFEHAVEGCRTLLEKARAARAPIVFVQSIRKADSIEFTVFGHAPMLLEGTPDAEIVDRVAPQIGEFVVQKSTHDPWARTKLEETISEIGCVPGEWTVLVAGVSLSACALAGGLGFADRLFRTVIPMDATAAGTVEEELQAYHLYSNSAYRYLMDFTTSALVTFAPAIAAREKRGLVRS